MKRKLLSTALIATLILSGCGARKDSSESTDIRFSNGSIPNVSASEMESQGFMDFDYSEAVADEAYWEPMEKPAAGSNVSTTDGDTSVWLTAASGISREMLVYSCRMNIDTLDFASTVDGFRALLDQYGGFIETENYGDGGAYGRWYSETAEKWQSYSATVRVPSRNYDAFCNSTGTLGDLRSKNASVQNLSTEYSDLSTTLEIYEAKEERYIALLAGITEDEYAVAVERELTDLQIEIARIKSRMNKISMDVSYSYVYITINEVKRYVSEPVVTDTFFDRLKNTVSDTWIGFVEFWESLLFWIIGILPYLVLIALLVFILFVILKKRIARRARLLQEDAAQNTAQMAQAVQMTQTPQTAQVTQAAQTAQTTQTTQAAQPAQIIPPAEEAGESPAEKK